MFDQYILYKHNSHKERISKKELYRVYKIFFGTLVSESRLKIINSLRHGKKNVSELISALGMDQAAVSHDLARLKQCGFVSFHRSGPFVYYSLNENTIKPLMKIIDRHMSQHCIHILHSMKRGKHHE